MDKEIIEQIIALGVITAFFGGWLLSSDSVVFSIMLISLYLFCIYKIIEAYKKPND